MLVGLVTSICWNLTVKGRYHWRRSWISVVQDYEKKLAKFLKKNLVTYLIFDRNSNVTEMKKSITG